MDFRQFLERSLYHGTVIDNLDSIRSFGLEPEIGDFVRSAYAGDYEAAGVDIDDEEPGTFFADKKSLIGALGAMKHHIAKKLVKDFHSITPIDIINHGLLLKVKDADIPQYDPYYHQPNTPGAEEGDYIAQERVRPDQYITGQGIIRLLRAAGIGIKTPRELRGHS